MHLVGFIIRTNTNALEGTSALSGQFSLNIYGVPDNYRTTALSEDWCWGPGNLQLKELKMCALPEFFAARRYSVFRNW